MQKSLDFSRKSKPSVEQKESIVPENINEKSPKVSLQFFGAIGVVGGNKICLAASNGKAILLDFGWSFDTTRKYLGDFMNPRRFEILFDSIRLEELPRPYGTLAGIYREDLFVHKDPNLLKLYDIEGGQPKCVRELLISHCHSDHIGNIEYLHPDIKLLCSPTNKMLLEHLDETSSPTSYFSGVITYKTLFKKGKLDGTWSTDPTDSHTPVETRKPELIQPNVPFKCAEQGLEVTFYETDHSLPGAGAYLIKDMGTGRKIVYTGDIRKHGPNKHLTEQFIQQAREFAPDVMIVEGTRLGREEDSNEKASENDVEKGLSEVFKEINQEPVPKLICFESANQDLWRWRSFYRAATANNRTLVVNAKGYDLIKQCVDSKLISDMDYAKLRVYLPKKSSGLYSPKDYSGSKDLSHVFQKEEEEVPVHFKKDGTPKKPSRSETIDPEKSFGIRAWEIHENPGNFVMYLPFYAMMDLCDLLPPPDSYYVISKSAPFDDEGVVDEKKRDNWLALFKFPKNHMKQIHCSGHIARDQLIEMIKTIHPKKIFPIHTTKPQEFLKMGLDALGIEVILPEVNKTYSI